ncbi:asparagine synthase-related protein [Photobacterium kishitanii]|nr:asparagine synthase-related protein [Photobacterium kishitanii]
MPSIEIRTLHHKIRENIKNEINKIPPDKTIAIPLSGGIDSTSVLLAALELKRHVQAFTFYLSESSRDLQEIMQLILA